MVMNLSKNILKKTLVIIPAYNEEDSIGPIIRGIKTDFPALDVLVIDDGSKDNTYNVANMAGAKVLRLVNNMGYGIALQTGCKYALANTKYDYIVQMDGDGQHNYADIPKLLLPLVNTDKDLIIGSRFINGQNGYKIPFARRVGIAFFRFLVHFFTKNQIKDITSGLQAYKRHVLELYTSDAMPYYYPDADVLILLLKGGFAVDEVSTPMNGTNNGKSMHSGLSSQVYYVFTMILSIMVILMKGLSPKHV